VLDLRDIGGFRRRPRELRPRPARQLTTRADRPAHRFRDLLERHLEHVVEDERDTFTGTQPPQHLQQCGAHLVVERHAVGGVGLTRGRDLESP
jgi:hypothetical protein